jgi:hypothetical protein
VFLDPSTFMAKTGTPTQYVLGQTTGWSFPDGATSGLNVTAEVPADWNTFTVDLLWTNLVTTGGAVRWGVQPFGLVVGQQVINGAVTDFTATAAGQSIAALSTYGTPTPVPASKVVALMVRRAGGDAADTLAGAVALLGVYLRRAS